MRYNWKSWAERHRRHRFWGAASSLSSILTVSNITKHFWKVSPHPRWRCCALNVETSLYFVFAIRGRNVAVLSVKTTYSSDPSVHLSSEHLQLFPFLSSVVKKSLCDFVLIILCRSNERCQTRQHRKSRSVASFHSTNGEMVYCCYHYMLRLAKNHVRFWFFFFKILCLYYFLCLPTADAKFRGNLKCTLIYLQHWWCCHGVHVHTCACVKWCIIQSQTVSNNNSPTVN